MGLVAPEVGAQLVSHHRPFLLREDLSMRKLMPAAAAVLLACGSSGPRSAATAPVASSAQAVRAFMQAAADNNLTRMGELWGSDAGPAAQTGSPPDYEKRLVIIQTYLRGDSVQVLSDVSVPGDDSHRRVTIALYRQTCAKQIPVLMVRTHAGGWIVNSVDLNAAGNPARPCESGS
jgi:hypothetical protein